jgi:hypothetical protein
MLFPAPFRVRRIVPSCSGGVRGRLLGRAPCWSRGTRLVRQRASAMCPTMRCHRPDRTEPRATAAGAAVRRTDGVPRARSSPASGPVTRPDPPTAANPTFPLRRLQPNGVLRWDRCVPLRSPLRAHRGYCSGHRTCAAGAIERPRAPRWEGARAATRFPSGTAGIGLLGRPGWSSERPVVSRHHRPFVFLRWHARDRAGGDPAHEYVLCGRTRAAPGVRLIVWCCRSGVAGKLISVETGRAPR